MEKAIHNSMNALIKYSITKDLSQLVAELKDATKKKNNPLLRFSGSNILWSISEIETTKYHKANLALLDEMIEETIETNKLEIQ